MKHYVIGDVHGQYKTLISLVKKLPKDSRLIFVGDLVDGGKNSSKVVKFVRENGHLCVMGNHEMMMVSHANKLAKGCGDGVSSLPSNVWFTNGGIDTLLSYGMIQLKQGKPVSLDCDKRKLETLKEDIKWMESLPLYIELDIPHKSSKPVVISHAPISSVWNLRNLDSAFNFFSKVVTTNRRNPNENTPIFNIFGHTPVEFGPEVKKHYVNVDTGCYKEKPGYSKLSAYCIESGDVFSAKNK